MTSTLTTLNIQEQHILNLCIQNANSMALYLQQLVPVVKDGTLADKLRESTQVAGL